MEFTNQYVLVWLKRAANLLEENKDYLTDLDAAIGDADHGTNIARGFAQVTAKVMALDDPDLGELFKTTGMTLMSSVGGASGMLYGNFFLRVAVMANGRRTLSPVDFVAAMRSGRDGIVQRGRAEPGDKTMIDAWSPAIEAMEAVVASGQNGPMAVEAAVAAAEAGMLATVPMQARKGRASYLGERSIGHQDPGATSTYLLLCALRDAFTD